MLNRFKEWRKRREFEADILVRVNQARRARNMPTVRRIPKGRRDKGDDCPIFHAVNADLIYMGPGSADFPRGTGEAIAKAWGTECRPSHRAVWDGPIRTEVDTDKVELPRELTAFISAFDRGDLPQYQLEPAVG